MEKLELAKYTDFSDLFASASRGEFLFTEQDSFWIERATSTDLRTSFQAAARQETVFLIGNRLSISYQFGRLGYSMFATGRDDGARNRLLFEDVTLSSKSLRMLFTFFEYSVFYLVKYPKFMSDPTYIQSSEGYADRLRILKETGLIDRGTEQTLRALKGTRDQFAHSFVDIDALTFEGKPVGDDGGEHFLESAVAVGKLLEEKFIEQQYFQIDWRLFSLVFKALQKARPKQA